LKKRVVVENRLEDVKNFFSGMGYDVRALHLNNQIHDIDTNQYDAIIVNDMNNSGLSDGTKNSGKVIESMGLVPHQVYEKMNQRIQQ